MLKIIASLLLIPVSLSLISCAKPELTTLGELIAGKNTPPPPPDFWEEEEANLGKNLLKGFLDTNQVYPLEEVNRYVSEVGEKLAKAASSEIPYRITVINGTTVNAFAFPGGQIIIYRGMLESLENESQLAAVIAHEMAHIAGKNPGRALQRAKSAPNYSPLTTGTGQKIDQLDLITNVAQGIILNGYGPSEELKADTQSMKYLADAGYDPAAVLEMQKHLKKVAAEYPTATFDLLQAHPPFAERIANAEKELKKMKRPLVSVNGKARVYRMNVLEPIRAYREGIRNHYVSAVLSKRVDKNGAPVEPFTTMNWKDNDFFVVVTLRNMNTASHSLMLYLHYAKDRLTGRTSPTFFIPEKPDCRTHIRVNGLGNAALVNEQLGHWTATLFLDTYKVDTFEFEITK